MIYLDYPKLIEDIETKVMYEGIELSKFCTDNGISKSTFYRVKRHTPINMKTFLFFVNWLGSSAEKYFTNQVVGIE